MSKMVVIVGSMNCMPTEYAMLLSKQGWKVFHYIDANANDALSNPLLSNRYTEDSIEFNISKMKFKHPLSFLLPNLLHRKILTELNMCDLVFLSGASISLARLIKKQDSRKVLALGYGDDLSVFCNTEWPLARLKQRSWATKFLFGWLVFFLQILLVSFQRKGLAACTHVAYFPQGFDKKTDIILNELIRDNKPQRLTRYSISTANVPVLQSTFLSTKKMGMKVMFPVRFSSSSDIFLGKGWKIFIEGVASYVKIRPNTDTIFYCFNKGDLLDEAKIYALNLGVENKIEWLDVVPFDILYSYMNNVDVIVDQLGDQWLGVGMWGALLGKPVISNLSKPSIEEKFSGSFFLHAADAQQLSSQLISCESLEFRAHAAEINTRFAIDKLSLESEFLTWGLTE